MPRQPTRVVIRTRGVSWEPASARENPRDFAVTKPRLGCSGMSRLPTEKFAGSRERPRAPMETSPGYFVFLCCSSWEFPRALWALLGARENPRNFWREDMASRQSTIGLSREPAGTRGFSRAPVDHLEMSRVIMKTRLGLRIFPFAGRFARISMGVSSKTPNRAPVNARECPLVAPTH